MNFRADELPDLGPLAPWAPELARTFVSLASDIALVIDGQGVIRSVAQGESDPLSPSAAGWVGQRWVDTVSGATRGKIEHMLQEVASTGIGRRREVEHPFQSEGSIPVAYSAIRFGMHGPVLATGRDLRTIAAIQQRFLEGQQELERGYWRARQAETRYRLLFQVATDAVLVLDAQDLRVIEANLAASRMFDLSAEQLSGRSAELVFEERSRAAVQDLLQLARATGRGSEIRARLVGKMLLASVAATPFRSEDSMRLLMRVRAVDDGDNGHTLTGSLARLVDESSDGVVVTDSNGAILMANPAFVRWVGLQEEAQLRGRAIMDWIELEGAPLSGLLPGVRGAGLTRRTPARIRQPDAAQPARAELSAALLTEGDQERIGFTLHRTDAARATPRDPGELQQALERLSAQVGDRSLQALMTEAAALAERHFVLAALGSTHSLPAAASLLNISLESLQLIAGRPGFGAPIASATRQPGPPDTPEA